MAIAGADKGRRLRARPPPAAPLTRSGAAAKALNSSSSSTISQNADAPGRSHSKAPLKRAATTDTNGRSASTARLQQAKKRPALANLTNCPNMLSTRNHIPAPQKPLINPKRRQPREANIAKENMGPACLQKIENRVPEVCHNNNIQRDTEIVDVTKPSMQTYANAFTQTSTSFEARSGPCAPRDLSARSRQGYTCEDDYLEGMGWSCEKYINIDGNIKDPQMCSSYAPEIYFYLQMSELKRRPAKNYIDTVQHDINPSMRGILVDWLVEVAEEYKLVPDTLYLTITYVDRYLSGNTVNRQQLQLLGIACMLIASKYEEICAPLVEDFCYITDNTYCRDEVLQMEKKILNYLQFEVTGPTTKTFLRRFIRAGQARHKAASLQIAPQEMLQVPNLQLEYLSNYLAELTLVDYRFLQYLPSMIAGSAVFLAIATLNPPVRPWTSTMQHYSGYKASELAGCVQAIHDLQCNQKKCTLPAVREKYKHQKFKSVANLQALPAIPSKYFEDIYDGVQ